MDNIINLEAPSKEPQIRVETGKVAGKITAVCDCGLHKHHARLKVLDTWAKKHTQKTGHQIDPKYLTLPEGVELA